ncbi:MAG: helix-turn-helix domain-containing protein [Salinigranum sp.]
MSVILELTIENEQFTLGRALSGPPEMRVELERIIPTGDTAMPFLWATGEDFEAFEAKLRENPAIRELRPLDRVDDSTLYRVEWTEDHEDFVEGIAQSEATVLQARSNGRWVFRLRFLDHDKLGQFQNYCTDHDITFHVERVYTLTEETERGHLFDLTPEQREALILGLRRGYFDTPSRASLSELASELGISQQALSNRIRRGNRQVLRKALLGSAADFE